jgi:hypothetical protein
LPDCGIFWQGLVVPDIVCDVAASREYSAREYNSCKKPPARQKHGRPVHERNTPIPLCLVFAASRLGNLGAFGARVSWILFHGQPVRPRPRMRARMEGGRLEAITHRGRERPDYFNNYSQ